MKNKLFNFKTTFKDKEFQIISYLDVINFTIGKKNYSCFLNNLDEVTFKPATEQPEFSFIKVSGASDGELSLFFNNGVHNIIFEKQDEKKVKEYFDYIVPFTELENDYDYPIKKVLNKNKSGIRRLSLPLYTAKHPKKVKVSNNFVILKLDDGDLIISGNLLSYNGNHLDLNRVVSDSRDFKKSTYTISEERKDLILSYTPEEEKLIDHLKIFIEYIKLNNL